MWPLKVPVKSFPSIEMVPVRAVAVWLLMSSVAETFFVTNRNSLALIVPVQCPTRFVERVTGTGVGVEAVVPDEDAGAVAGLDGCAGFVVGAVTGGSRSGLGKTGWFNVTSDPGDDDNKR